MESDYIHMFIEALKTRFDFGQDEIQDHLEDTPRRITKMYHDFFDVDEPKISVFPSDQQPQFIFVKDIPVRSLCAHHFLPIIGKATVAYLPSDKIIGLSKPVRIVDYFARRPQVQEKLTDDVADYIFNLPELRPQAVGVHISAVHQCMEFRGVREMGIETVTHALRGSLLVDAAQRSEYMQLLKG